MKRMLFVLILSTINQAHAFSIIDPVRGSYTFSGPLNFSMYGIPISCHLSIETEFSISNQDLVYAITSATVTGPNWGCDTLVFQGAPWTGATSNNETPTNIDDPFPLVVDNVSMVGIFHSCSSDFEIVSTFFNGSPASNASSIEIDQLVGDSCVISATLTNNDVNLY